MPTPSPNLHSALMAIATAQDVLAIPARLWRQRHALVHLDSAVQAELRAQRRVIRRRLGAESLGLSLTLARLRLRKVRIRLTIFLLRTPDHLTAFLIVIFRRRHGGSEEDAIAAQIDWLRERIAVLEAQSSPPEA